jgi:molybdopterin molybdotransferase
MFFAELKKPDQTCYLLGLPGNPAAVYVGMQIYTSTLLDALQGQASSLQWFSAKLSHDLKADARERFLRMSVQFDQATLKVQSLAKQQSHMLSNLMQANCLVRIPAGDKIEAGQIVQGIFI